MGILGQKSKIKPAPQTITVQKVVVPAKTKPRSSLGPNSNSNNSNGLRAPSSSKAGSSASSRLSPNPKFARTKSASPYPSSSDEKRAAERKRKAVTSTPRDSPALFDDDDDSEDDEDDDPFRKRRRLIDETGDANRKLRNKRAFDDKIRDSPIDEVAVELQYPSRCKPEKYELVWKKDRIDAVADILKVVKHVAETYLTEDEAQPFIDNQASFRRRMERASNENIHDLAAFKTALEDYNKKLISLVDSGTIAKNIDRRHRVPPELVDFILTQVYDRTVAPKVELLNKYQAGSDNVYGELRYPFVRHILHEHCHMTSDQVYVDLGSGVGNTVLQAALEIGCRSYGCEIVEQSCNFADAQLKEFRARCILWGIEPGRAHLERADFRQNPKISKVLKEADVILVNNKAFTPQLNKALTDMFLDLKTGCKIISLKNFVLGNEKNSTNDVANSILDVEEHRYHGDWVSWASSDGEYFVSTKR
ncbi:histone-lysine N-methyltransferase- H3 lysine-79 specific [Apiospora kogelbergensis]|uniref:histone-lysine N-methyltransferase- H3 lysine-79 specific n=1 Tax=Apiospora kogelbergensis TaxID=1337665 RepID=UPI003130644D